MSALRRTCVLTGGVICFFTSRVHYTHHRRNPFAAKREIASRPFLKILFFSGTTPSLIRPDKTEVKCGVMRENVQKTEDKTPIIGDIPLVGRAFRTNVDQHIKRNLVIFVTARVITPAGVPLNEEEEEGLLPPELPEVPAYKKGGRGYG